MREPVAIVPRAFAAHYASSPFGPQTTLAVSLRPASNTASRERQLVWQRSANIDAGGFPHTTDT